MINQNYFLILLSLSTGILSLLGSLSIFVSLIIQRRVERLQEILEELVDQSYIDDINLTSKIYQLINRYQMHYILPSNPGKILTTYINISIIFIIFFWFFATVLTFEKPFKIHHTIYLSPVIISIIILFYFRKLLKNAINPLDNKLLNSIIPPPVKLRSVSFLSKYVNVSVKSLLKQARLTVTIEKEKNEKGFTENGIVVLKQELSFDDFFYYFTIYTEKECIFIGFGNLIMKFSPDAITKKPTPIQKNINIPLGMLNWSHLSEKINSTLLIFPQGEKHPIQYDFELAKEEHFFVAQKDAQCYINQNITYKFTNTAIDILECKTQVPYLAKISPFFTSEAVRKYSANIKKPETTKFLVCKKDILVR